MSFEKQLIQDIIEGKLGGDSMDVIKYIGSNYIELRKNRDKCRSYFLNTASIACEFATIIDEGPTQETREACCIDGSWAYNYATYVDKKVCDETREACCRYPETAFTYAWFIDRVPRDDTRKACLSNPRFACKYAINLDECFREDTWNAVKGTTYEEEYRNHLKVTR